VNFVQFLSANFAKTNSLLSNISSIFPFLKIRLLKFRQVLFSPLWRSEGNLFSYSQSNYIIRSRHKGLTHLTWRDFLSLPLHYFSTAIWRYWPIQQRRVDHYFPVGLSFPSDILLANLLAKSSLRREKNLDIYGSASLWVKPF